MRLLILPHRSQVVGQNKLFCREMPAASMRQIEFVPDEPRRGPALDKALDVIT
jgi:hypothetical protein